MVKTSFRMRKRQIPSLAAAVNNKSLPSSTYSTTSSTFPSSSSPSTHSFNISTSQSFSTPPPGLWLAIPDTGAASTNSGKGDGWGGLGPSGGDWKQEQDQAPPLPQPLVQPHHQAGGSPGTGHHLLSSSPPQWTWGLSTSHFPSCLSTQSTSMATRESFDQDLGSLLGQELTSLRTLMDIESASSWSSPLLASSKPAQKPSQPTAPPWC